MPRNPENPNPPETPKPRRRKKGGWLRSEIASRLSPLDKLEREWTVDPDLSDFDGMTDEQMDKAIAARPFLTVDEFIDRVLARKRAARTRHANQSRPPSIPKWGRPLCGAKTRKGTPCQAPPVWDKEHNRPRNGRCRMHGGLSTGPKTPEGKAKSLSKLKNYKGGV